jgi:hypothetical protein
MFSALNWENLRGLSFNSNCFDVCSDVHLLTQDKSPPPSVLHGGGQGWGEGEQLWSWRMLGSGYFLSKGSFELVGERGVREWLRGWGMGEHNVCPR